MKKLISGFSLLFVGLLVASCVDKHEEVDEESRPDWLGGSIYEELSTRQSGQLEGTFTTYLRLVDDLGYGETLSRTGSKTVFPANDDAFNRFFASRQWPNVSRYEDLSTAQKKLLLYNSMLDNAMLVNMMSNVAGSNEVIRGQAMKHTTSVSVIDSVTHYSKPSTVYQNNPYFKRFDNKEGGIHLVGDATTPMMIHFTREFMLSHSLTTSGDESDFSVLTGQVYDEKEQPGYVFRNKIIHKDVTCQNGYIHQVQDVIVPPGNMAQVLKQQGGDTELFSRMLDRFALPLYNAAVTRDYRASAAQYGWEPIDSIFEVRYMSSSSYDNKVQKDPDGNNINTGWLLRFDPGWNQYYLSTGQTGNGDGKQSDAAAILVPDDDAVRGYFLPAGTYNGNQGSGAFLVDRYGKKPNTLENLEENIDSIPQDKIQVILRNLMQTQFTKTVPSLFDAVTDNASDLMGLQLSDVRKTSDGKYDVRIANNGVIYVLNRMIAPPDFSSVLAPALVSDKMKVVNWVIQNKSASSYSGSSTVEKYDYSIDLDYYTYLLAMTANYAQFLPTDEAFGTYYVNAASLSTAQPEVIHFFFDTEKYKATSGLGVSHWKYDPVTRMVTDSIGEYVMEPKSVTSRPIYNVVKSVLNEFINMHTIVLEKGEVLGQNKYYTTKLGAGVRVTGNTEGSTVGTSAQKEGLWPAAPISKVYPEQNGVAYQLDGLLQPPTQSVYSVLKNNPQFSEFLNLCMFFDNPDFMKWLGISTDYDSDKGMTESDQYLVFEKPNTKGYNPENDASANADYMMATYEDDYVVKYFNTFNYTVYAPNNAAMEAAYAKGLPRWERVMQDYEDSEAGNLSEDYETVSKRLLKDVQLLRQFVRYHFQNTTVFANNYGKASKYSTFTPDANNINLKLAVTSIANGQLKVKDEAGVEHTIIDGAAGKVANEMTRDVILDARYDKAKTVYTSSFAVVHEIDEALCPNRDGRFSTLIASARRR